HLSFTVPSLPSPPFFFIHCHLHHHHLHSFPTRRSSDLTIRIACVSRSMSHVLIRGRRNSSQSRGVSDAESASRNSSSRIRAWRYVQPSRVAAIRSPTSSSSLRFTNPCATDRSRPTITVSSVPPS